MQSRERRYIMGGLPCTARAMMVLVTSTAPKTVVLSGGKIQSKRVSRPKVEISLSQCRVNPLGQIVPRKDILDK